MAHEHIEKSVEILLRGLACRDRDVGEDRFRGLVALRIHGEHLSGVISRVVGFCRGPGRGRISPTRQNFRHIGDNRPIVGGNGILVLVENRGAVGIQLRQPKGEQLHQLTRVIFVGGGVFGRIGLVVVCHVQISAHGGAERDRLDHNRDNCRKRYREKCASKAGTRRPG